MANEFQHKDPGATLTQAEYITTDGTGHIFDSQAQGDIVYASSSTVLSRLGKSGTTTHALLNTGTSNNPAWAQLPLASAVSGTLPVANGGTGITSLASGVATFLGTSSSANLRAALTDETGTGGAVFATSPTLVTPALGTPASGVLTNATGLPTAGIVDDAVTLGKMAGITRGSIIVGNSSGNPAALGIGSNTYVLTSDATDIAWAAAGGTSLSGSTNNTVATVTGANALIGEANLTFSTDLTVTGGNVVIGTAGKGIDFSNQASPSAGMTAELLDRYEIGTFTPALKNGVSGNTMSHATQFGHYTRIGNRVYINLRVIVNGNGDATNAAMAIFGLPFTCDSTANSETGMICGYSAGLNLGAAGYSLNGATDANGTAKFWLKQWSATGGNSANVTRDEISTDATLNFSGMYEVD